MKTTKIFLMAALALTFAACSNDDNEILNPAQPAKAEGITITATLAPKSSAGTRAVAEGKDGDSKDIIKATWAKNEHIAILYEKAGTKYAADATITAVDGTTGVATIEFTVESGTADNTECTLVYPAKLSDGTTTVYNDAKTGVKDAATLLASQDGTLSTNLDVRVGAGKIKTSTPGLDVTTQPEAQFAIFKFDVKNADATASINVKPLTITIGAQNYVITPADAKSTLYAALPDVSGKTVSFSATGSDSKTYVFSKDNVTFAAGKYYQSTVKMAPTVTLTPGQIGYLYGGDKKTIGDITIELTGDASFHGAGHMFVRGEFDPNKHSSFEEVTGAGTFTFTSSVGNIKRIDINHDWGMWSGAGAGWPGSYEVYENGKFTWSGTPAASVTLNGSQDWEHECSIMNISSIVFTLEK